MLHIHQYTKFEFVRNINLYEGSWSTYPYKRVGVYLAKCTVCGKPKTKRVRT